MTRKNDLSNQAEPNSLKSVVTNIQRYCIHDGPGIRTTVFLKGCHLRCPWCCNPECVNAFPELGFTRTLCNACGNCMDSCPEKAISLDSDGTLITIDRTRCTNCGKCCEVCYRGALKVYGWLMSVAEVFEEVLHDKPFYSSSGGGLTVSGGEGMLQYQFVISLFTLARQAGIHTAVETCGYINPRIFKEVLDLTDYVLFDLKLMDSSAHKQIIGQPNERIIENARYLASSGLPMLFRMPLVPCFNDSTENIKASAQFLNSINSPVLELIPYHRFAQGKYEGLGKIYTMKDVLPPSGEHIKHVIEQYKSFGIDCRVSI